MQQMACLGPKATRARVGVCNWNEKLSLPLDVCVSDSRRHMKDMEVDLLWQTLQLKETEREKEISCYLQVHAKHGTL